MPAAPVQPGHCILSHGFESGPDATKVTALAEVAVRLGWTCERPDYTDLDAMREAGELGDVAGRLERLLGLARVAAARGPLVLAGSSLGAWISGLVSLRAAAAPTVIVHGWDDELIPAAQVVEWAAARRDRLLLVDDTHRLSANVGTSAAAFESLLLDVTADRR